MHNVRNENTMLDFLSELLPPPPDCLVFVQHMGSQCIEKICHALEREVSTLFDFISDRLNCLDQDFVCPFFRLRLLAFCKKNLKFIMYSI